MAENTDAKTDAKTPSDEPGAKPAPAAEQRQQVTLDESKMSKSYANFCRVTPGFEELIIDFGLSQQPIGAPGPQGSISIDQRVIVNYFMAKRLLSALAGSVQRYEQIFGVLETDVQKRVRQPPQAGGGGTTPPASS